MALNEFELVRFAPPLPTRSEANGASKRVVDLESTDESKVACAVAAQAMHDFLELRGAGRVSRADFETARTFFFGPTGNQHGGDEPICDEWLRCIKLRGMAFNPDAVRSALRELRGKRIKEMRKRRTAKC